MHTTRPAVGRRRALGALLVACTLAGCEAAAGGPPAQGTQPTRAAVAAADTAVALPADPTTAPAPCRLVIESSAPAAAAGAPERAAAVDASLAQGLDLIAALDAAFGKSITGLTPDEKIQALYVLSGLDACPAAPAGVRDDIPQVITLLTADEPAADLRVPAADPNATDPNATDPNAAPAPAPTP